MFNIDEVIMIVVFSFRQSTLAHIHPISKTKFLSGIFLVEVKNRSGAAVNSHDLSLTFTKNILDKRGRWVQHPLLQCMGAPGYPCPWVWAAVGSPCPGHLVAAESSSRWPQLGRCGACLLRLGRCAGSRRPPTVAG